MLDIITVPNIILAEKTKKIDKIDKALLSLIDEMRQTMRNADGVGLAAPQINKSISLAIVEIPANPKRYPHIKSQPSPFFVLINPKIISVSSQTDFAFEGCLSIPGYEVEVQRPVKVVVEALDQKGIKQTITGEGLLCRALQHEIDHLNGILITDHGNKRPIQD